MSSIRETWAALGTASKSLAIVAPLVVGIAIAGIALTVTAPPPPDETAGEPEPTPLVLPSGVTPPPLPPDPTLDPDASPLPTPTPAPPQADPLLGTDGRLTVLLLGSDFRPAHPGNRTDAILVVSIDPSTGAAAGFSIPRDTVDFPMPDSGRYRAKVNGLYQHLQSRSRDGGRSMKAAIARAYDLEVDSYVFIGFEGFKKMVRAIGGVRVTLAKAYYDPYYWVNSRTQGWGLPKGTSHLNAEEALIFARTRKGDNDFERARRQQQLILAVLDKVRDQGPGRLPRLLGIARDTVRTDLPLDRAGDLFELIATTDIGEVDRVVFGPRKYASSAGGASFAPNLAEQRAWIAGHFPEVRPFGAWPLPTVAPVASAAPPASSGAPAASATAP